MSEKSISIPLPNSKKVIDGVLTGGFADKLIVLCPGLGGWMNDLLIYEAARYFSTQGLSSLRVSFYGDDENQPNIADFGVHTCGENIDSVVSYVKKQGVGEVVVIGHSHSGMGILYSKEQKFDKAVLWDPSHTDGYEDPESIKNLERDFVFFDKIRSYVSPGAGQVLSKKIFDDNAPGSDEMAKKFIVPSLIVSASYSQQMQDYGKKYAQLIAASATQKIIPNSSHPFTEIGAMENLFAQTFAWLEEESN